jgi:hypothetical protein
MNRLTVFLIVLALSLAGATAASATVPILTGQPNPLPDAKGFGQVKPKTIYLGGDPTGLVCRIHWLTWGGQLAIGTGVGWYITSHQAVSEGTPASAVVVLSRLGTWHGRPAYKAWGWYYPEAEAGSEFIHPAVCQINGHAA